MAERRYEVRGEDELGDIHIFLTNDRQRAEGVAEVMREDLEAVGMVDDQADD